MKILCKPTVSGRHDQNRDNENDGSYDRLTGIRFRVLVFHLRNILNLSKTASV
jgi:hypothetical protein